MTGASPDVRPVTALYARLIDDTPHIDPAVQQRIVDHLVAGQHWALLGRLAAREDVDPSVDRRLGERDEAQVLAGWASRPGRSSVDLIERLKGETRATVLIALARTPGLDQDVYAELAAKTTPKITETLVANKTVGTDVRLLLVEAIVEIADRQAFWQAFRLVDMLAGDDPVLLKAVAERSNQPSILVETLDRLERPASEIIDGIVGRIDEIVGRNAHEARRSHFEVSELLGRLAIEDLSDEQAHKLHDLSVELETDLPETRRAWTTTLQTVRELLSPDGRALAATFGRLAVSEDPVTSITLYAALTARTRDQTYQDLFQTVTVRNTVLPPALVRMSGTSLRGRNETRLVKNWYLRGELDAIADLIMHSRNEPGWLTMLDDPLTVLAAVSRRARRAGIPTPAWVLNHRAVLDSPERAIDTLPWTCLHDAAGDTAADDARRAGILAAVQRRLVERLGDDPQIWETFTALSDDFDGTLTELLDTARHV